MCVDCQIDCEYECVQCVAVGKGVWVEVLRGVYVEYAVCSSVHVTMRTYILTRTYIHISIHMYLVILFVCVYMYSMLYNLDVQNMCRLIYFA